MPLGDVLEEVLAGLPPERRGLVRVELARSASEIMGKLSRLPLDQIADNLNETIGGANKLANAPELKQTIVRTRASSQKYADSAGGWSAGCAPGTAARRCRSWRSSRGPAMRRCSPIRRARRSVSTALDLTRKEKP